MQQFYYRSPALIIGLTVTLCHLLAIPYTGCGINPARSLGPAVISGQVENLWIFCVAPYVGAGMAAIEHNHIFKSKMTEKYDVTNIVARKNDVEMQDTDEMKEM
jgi:aquaporin-1